MNTHKLTMRLVQETEIASFHLEEGEALDDRVRSEIERAGREGKLERLATRVGLPAAAVTEIGTSENLTGGEEILSIALYGPDGAPLAERDYRIEPVKDAVMLVAVDGEDEQAIGVFPSEAVARQVGTFWKNGHLAL